MVCEQMLCNIFYVGVLLEYYCYFKIVYIVCDFRDVFVLQKNCWKCKCYGGDNIFYLEIIRVWFNYYVYIIIKFWVKVINFVL